MATSEEIAELIALHESDAEIAECTLTRRPETLPIVAAAYDGEPDAERRATLIHCLWAYRDHAALPTLLKALREADDRVWKGALDGLVALVGNQVVQALREVREAPMDRGGGGQKREWVDEAIEQIGESKHG